MLSTAPAAVVEPKEKSQNPGAKAKRLKGLRTNPDFVEGVSEERAAAQMWEDRHADLHRKYKAMMDERLSCQREVIDTVELKNKYIEQLEGNKVLVDAIQGYKELLAVQEETIRAMRATRDAQDVMLDNNRENRGGQTVENSEIELFWR